MLFDYLCNRLEARLSNELKNEPKVARFPKLNATNSPLENFVINQVLKFISDEQ